MCWLQFAFKSKRFMKSSVILFFLIAWGSNLYGQAQINSDHAKGITFLWGHYNPGPVPIDSFKAQHSLFIPVGYELIQASVYFNEGNSQTPNKFSLFSNNLENLRSVIDQSSKGTIVVITKVLVRDVLGNRVYIDDFAFILY